MKRPMSNALSILVALLVATATSSGAEIESTEDLQWFPATDSRFVVSGLPFFQENEGKWWRFPRRAETQVPPLVWRLSKCPSGGRIRFRSDTTALAVRLAYPSLPGMRNMHAFGQAGVDAYVDGQYIASVAPRSSTQVEAFFFKNVEKRVREYTLYLPLYLGVDIQALGFEPGATISLPSAFAVDKPVVYYGTSITQGGCASRPGMSYQAILGRRLNIDFVNFGYSGSGKGEPEVARLVSEVTASCFVMDMAQNNPNAESLEAVFLPFIEILRARHPGTPILCTTPIYSSSELPGTKNEGLYPEMSLLEGMRDVIRRAVQSRIASGDKNIYLVEGYTLLGPDQGDGLVDGAHPNDLGFQWMADGLEPHLRRLLGLKHD